MQFSFRSVSGRLPSWIATLVICTAATAFLTSCKKDEGGGGGGASAPDLSSPKKAGLAFAKAADAGDLSGMKQSAIGTDDQFAVAKGMSDMMGAMKRYQAAAVKKFGDKGKLPGGMPDLAAEIEKTDEKIDGDKATLIDKTKTDDKHPMTLKKDGGNWKVDLNVIPPEAAAMGKAAKKTVEALDAVTKDVEAGKYKTAEEAMAALGAAMTAAGPPAP
jgi:hypothetical protein